MGKTELLLPAGNVESFHAALKGGADAVYLGLQKFNARGRAMNFSFPQFQLLLKEAEQAGVKVYVTLNTVIKNEELPELLDYLYQLSQLPVSAVIIQDWGVYYFIRRFFPGLALHASTQMANHNSAGAVFSKSKGFKRVVMARELTFDELKSIREKSDIELEVFVHGALCYSFSGMCLFSSYLGGMGANRGLCAQPCRRLFQDNGKEKFIFSLKDNQLVKYVPEISSIGIDSLKIEGRMKSADYVYHVAEGYRKVLDENNVEDAAAILRSDMGRDKTDYFFGNEVSHAITENPNTGIFLGNVTERGRYWFKVKTDEELSVGNRLRIRDLNDIDRKSIKIKSIEKEGNIYKITSDNCEVSLKDRVFLAGIRLHKFSSKLSGKSFPLKNKAPRGLVNKALNSIKTGKPSRGNEIFVRIDSIGWIKKLHFDSVDGVIINLTKREWGELRLDSPFMQKNRNKLYIEFPKFIPEKNISFYEKLAASMLKAGFRNFMLSHLSQKELLPVGAVANTNENVYIYNDAAVTALREEGIKNYTFPLENDFDNLLKGKERTGFIPVWFYPHLFFSRMPVKIDNVESIISDDRSNKFRREIREGITYILPSIPVSLLQYGNLLRNNGFHRFLIDLSFEKPSKHILKKLTGRLARSEQVQPSSNFNFKKGLK